MADNLDTDRHGDDRIVRESGTDARIAAIVAPVARDAGFRLVRVRLSGQNGLTLQIMAERDDGTMAVEDCETLSRAVSPALDAADLVEQAYHLEVSSPGIDRPLVRKSDFAQWRGSLVKLETSVMVGGRKRFRGKIADAGPEGVVVERDQVNYGDEPSVTIPYEAIDEARLVLTDDLVRDALRRDKQARQELKKRQAAEVGDDPVAATGEE